MITLYVENIFVEKFDDVIQTSQFIVKEKLINDYSVIQNGNKVVLQNNLYFHCYYTFKTNNIFDAIALEQLILQIKESNKNVYRASQAQL